MTSLIVSLWCVAGGPLWLSPVVRVHEDEDDKDGYPCQDHPHHSLVRQTSLELLIHPLAFTSQLVQRFIVQRGDGHGDLFQVEKPPHMGLNRLMAEQSLHLMNVLGAGSGPL